MKEVSKMDTQYDDIINLPHHVSPTRPQMSMQDRAAQFSPFAALTGYDSAVKETARLTDQRINLDEYEIEALNARIQLIAEYLEDKPEVSITFFKPDERKAGGAYLTATGTVKKIDEYERIILMQGGEKIPMNEVIEIAGELFRELE